MKISAALYSSINRPLLTLVNYLDKCHIDYFHLDCMDDPSVFDDIERIKAISETPVDLHLISASPDIYYDKIVEYGVDCVTVQFEEALGPVHFPKNEQIKYGLAITSATPVQVFEPYKDTFDFILMMTTSPGMSGGKLDRDTFKRIRKFRNLYPDKEIHVDGGVNDETGFILRMLGVNLVVSGTYLVNHESIGEALLHLRSSVIHSDYKVKDFMIDREDVPMVKSEQLSVANIVNTADRFNLGFAAVVDGNYRLLGTSSNNDIRKGMLKNLDDFNCISIDDIVVKNPISINENATISDLLELIGTVNAQVSHLPVTNDQGEITGALSFIHLIRSEL